MDSHANLQPLSPTRPLRRLANYRVVARRRDHNLSLVTLAENLRQAVIRAKAFCDTIATGSNGLVSARVEEWVDTLTEGEWQPVSAWHGGFSQNFATKRRRGNTSNGDHCHRPLPRTGDTVECVLLGEKTRKGGWKAKLSKHGTEGPISNTGDVPKSAEAGQAIVLRVGAVSHDGKRIQFPREQADNPECRYGQTDDPLMKRYRRAAHWGPVGCSGCQMPTCGTVKI